MPIAPYPATSRKPNTKNALTLRASLAASALIPKCFSCPTCVSKIPQETVSPSQMSSFYQHSPSIPQGRIQYDSYPPKSIPSPPAC